MNIAFNLESNLTTIPSFLEKNKKEILAFLGKDSVKDIAFNLVDFNYFPKMDYPKAINFQIKYKGEVEQAWQIERELYFGFYQGQKAVLCTSHEFYIEEDYVVSSFKLYLIVAK